MPACAPQRFLANNRNLIRTAILTPSSVLPVAQSVVETPVARIGTAQVQIAGAYEGAEEATFDVEIVDTAVTNPLISAPIFSGEGSGTLSAITSSLAPQKITVQLNDDGIPTTSSAVDFEGVKIVARDEGAIGNLIRITIDQSSLVFTGTTFSLLSDLKAGAGDDNNGLTGPAFDWDTAVLGADNIIPAGAHRVAFGDDTSRVYLSYKKFVTGAWVYHFVPALQTDVPAGTLVKFVTGGRSVAIDDGTSPVNETYTDIVTDYDLFNALKTQSQLVTIDGVVANDRSPTGQAARELLVRTDAHVERSSGSGSQAATGFAATFAGALANTELITARATAVTFKDSPLAHVGAEVWKLSGSVSGDLGEIVTGVPYLEPDGKFGLTIPQRLPDGFGTQRGNFTVTERYVTRPVGVENPPICVGNLTLGPSAVNQTFTLEWTKRPSGECACVTMPFDRIDDTCLGIATNEGGTVDYSPEALTVLSTFYGYLSGIADLLTDYREGYGLKRFPDIPAGGVTPPTFTATYGADGISMTGSVDSPASLPAWNTDATVGFLYNEGLYPDSLTAFAQEFETAVGRIDLVTDSGFRSDGFTGMNTVSSSLNTDMSTYLSGITKLKDINTNKYRVKIGQALIAAGLSPLGKASASSQVSGDGCWQDYGDSYYWTVVGSDGGEYAPAFTNHTYYSSKRASQTTPYFSTKEIAFQVNCGCVDRLKIGDQIIISVGGAGFGATYQVGDLLTLPIISAQPLFLAGGQDGNAIQTWNVFGSVDGPLANFVFDPGAPTSYSNGSPATLGFTYTPGGIASVKGDRFTFSIEGGRFKWRKNGGAWSADTLIPDGPTALSDGLTLEFVTGASPSFVAADLFSFRALQPWAVSNIQSPDAARWQWSQGSPDVATLVGDFGAAQTVGMLGIALHTMPAGTTLLIEGGTAPGVYTQSETVTYRAGTIAHTMSEPWSVRYVRLTITGAGEAGIGWLWLGDPMKTELSADVQRTRSYLVSRANGGLYQGGKSLAMTFNHDVSWQEAAMNESDAALIGDFLDWIKTHDDEPFIFLPNVTRPELAEIQRVVSDAVEFTELSDYNRDASFEFRASVKLPMAGVWQ